MGYNNLNLIIMYMEPLFFHYMKYYLQSRVPSFTSNFLGEKVGLAYSDFNSVPLKSLIFPAITYDHRSIPLIFVLQYLISYYFIARFNCWFQFINFNI